MVFPDRHIDRCVHFNAADFRSGQILSVVNVVNMIFFNYGKNAAQVAHNSRLPAVVDIAPAYDMGTDAFLRPPLGLRLTDTVPFRLGAVLIFQLRPFIIVAGLQIFTQGNTAAFGMGNIAVLNDPALRPVGTDHPLLISRRRSPLRRGFRHRKAGQRNIADSLRFGIKAVPPYIDFHTFPARVIFVEIGVKYGSVFLFVLLCKPGINGKIRIPGSPGGNGMRYLFQRSNFIHGFIVQI